MSYVIPFLAALLVLIGSCLFIFYLPLAASAEPPALQAKEIEIFSPDSKPYNLTYADWTVKWWQWVESIPADRSPMEDNTGERCSISQTDPNMWFLAGTAGTADTRTCVMTAGKAVIIPIVNVECDSYHDNVKGNELHSCAKLDQDGILTRKATINGKPIENIDNFRIASPLFNLTWPENNAGGVPPNTTTETASEGWFVILKPLPPGIYNIMTLGSTNNPEETKKKPDFSTQVFLTLIVK